ncbi:uncharacterized protein V1510DRAFT_417323 [Dipodascopsis tothii]|uniref:uncharacterized protein n=1 Tax=Dipodascopsis tothii TaxID=44089 RepID=UPI0034CE0055
MDSVAQAVSAVAAAVAPGSSELCSSLAHPSMFTLVVSVGLTVGVVVSYLPQHLRIIARGTAEGLSGWFLMLGVMSGSCAVVNIVLLSADVLGCCSVLSGGLCIAAAMGVIQVVLQAALFALVLVLFLMYYPRTGAQKYNEAVVASAVAGVHFFATAATGLYVHAIARGRPESTAVETYAGLLGLEGAAITMIQYFPQIFTTLRLRSAGSLSMYTLIMQSPGGFLWAYSLAAREGTAWSSWMPYFVAAVMQSVLLVICIVYAVRDRRERVVYIPIDEDAEDEAPVGMFDDQSDEY